jgi:cell wall-associated NlpC family hydrolase
MLCAVALFAPAGAVAGDGGGIGVGGSSGGETTPGSKAKLVNGRAIPPADAPQRVQDVINAANKIRNKPYKYGGGHGSWNDSGYDCSGSVSYALHGGHLLDTPLDSTGLGRYGAKKQGQWITIYGAPSHAYMVVAGLRFDTSMTPGNGPSWSKSMRSTPETYKVRHPNGL